MAPATRANNNAKVHLWYIFDDPEVDLGYARVGGPTKPGWKYKMENGRCRFKVTISLTEWRWDKQALSSGWAE